MAIYLGNEKNMRGATRLREIIAVHLSQKLPGVIDMMRKDYDLDEHTLPYPIKYNTSNPTEAEVYPYIGAYITGAAQYVRTGAVGKTGNVEWDVTYEVTIFIAARTAYLGTDDSGLDKWERPGRDSAIRIRDDLISAIQSVILETPSFGTAGSDNRVILDEDSLRIAYPEPIAVNTFGAYSCSGLVTANMSMIESTIVPAIGTANTTNVTIELLHTGEIDAQVLQYP